MSSLVDAASFNTSSCSFLWKSLLSISLILPSAQLSSHEPQFVVYCSLTSYNQRAQKPRFGPSTYPLVHATEFAIKRRGAKLYDALTCPFRICSLKLTPSVRFSIPGTLLNASTKVSSSSLGIVLRNGSLVAISTPNVQNDTISTGLTLVKLGLCFDQDFRGVSSFFLPIRRKHLKVFSPASHVFALFSFSSAPFWRVSWLFSFLFWLISPP